jgi:hypothetical protein
MASYLALALSYSSAHELGDRTQATATEVFKGAMVVDTVLEKVYDLLVGGALVEEASHVLA